MYVIGNTPTATNNTDASPMSTKNFQRLFYWRRETQGVRQANNNRLDEMGHLDLIKTMLE